jgi:hypothetical protein
LRTFRLEIAQALATASDLDDWMNCDETAVLMHRPGVETWARRGAEGVQIHVDGNEKQAHTVMATCTASGRKLPLLIITKGKTRRSVAAFDGILGEHAATFSDNGWMTNATMQLYLEMLRALPEHQHERTLHLLLDCYAAHRTPEVRRLAAQLNIVLHYIPPGMTDALQPLDRYVFGALKAAYSRVYRGLVTPTFHVGKKEFLQMLLASWDSISHHAILRGWDCFASTE